MGDLKARLQKLETKKPKSELFVLVIDDRYFVNGETLTKEDFEAKYPNEVNSKIIKINRD